MPNYFAFRLRKDAKNYYKVVDGMVNLVAPPSTNPALSTDLEIYGPDGWKEEGIRRERHPDYHGLFTSYSESLKYVLDGAQILRHVYNTEGSEGVLQLEVLRNRDSDWLYEPYFIGEIDLTTYVATFDGVTANTKDGGISALIRANDSVSYEIQMTGNANLEQAYMSGVLLKNRATFTISSNPAGDNVNQSNIPQMNIANQDTGFGADIFDAAYREGLVGNVGIENSRIYVASLDQTLSINYDFSLRTVALDGLVYGPTTTLTTGFAVYSLGNNIATVYPLKKILPGNNPIGTFVLKGTINIPVVKGDTIVYFSTIENVNAVEWLYNDDPTLAKGIIDFGFDTIYPPSFCPVIRYYEHARQIIQQVAPGAQFRSNYLNTNNVNHYGSYPYRLYATCGDAIRRLPNPVMSSTLKNIMQDMKAIYGLGLGVEGNTVVIEPLSYFYNNTEICDLGEVTDLEISAAVNLMGNQLNVGYADQDYDTLNGKDETNGLWEWKMPLKTKNIIELIAAARADRYGIETIRINLQGKNTTDNKADKEIFVLELDKNPVPRVANGETMNAHDLYRPQPVTGVLSPSTAYNMTIRPSLNMRRSGRYLQSVLFQRNGQKITFQTTQKNREVSSTFGGVLVKDKADINLPLDIPLFQPHVIRCKGILPGNWKDLVSANTYGYYRASWQGVPIKVYPNKDGQTDAERHLFDFEFILHPETDLNTLLGYA